MYFHRYGAKFSVYQDVHVMIWIGFGFLMTFLRRYGQSAVGLTFLVGAILVQVAILVDGIFNMEKDGKAPLSLESLSIFLLKNQRTKNRYLLKHCVF